MIIGQMRIANETTSSWLQPSSRLRGGCVLSGEMYAKPIANQPLTPPGSDTWGGGSAAEGVLLGAGSVVRGWDGVGG